MPTAGPRLLVLAGLALVVVAGATWLGPLQLDWSDVASFGPGSLFWSYRVPRTALAALAGAGLACSGAVLQNLFRNPLAEPYTLGIASGASLGAAIAFLLHVDGALFGVPRLSLFAFAGAGVSIVFVTALARSASGRDMTRVLLAGICFAYMCSAGVMLTAFLAGQAVTNDLVIWMMGSLARHRPQAVLEVAIVLLPVLAVALLSHRALDLLAMGDELAAARGVAVGATVWSCYGLVGVLTAVIVANCGPIAFIGLLVPHAIRALVGIRALPVLIGSAFGGAAFLALCDGLARSYRYEIPVGVLTNILGALFFLYLLATRRRFDTLG